MGWYSNNSLSNLTYADYEMNGRYCKSGLAFPVDNVTANCSATSYILYNGQNITDPYPCDPTNQSSLCTLQFAFLLGADPSHLPQTNLSVNCNCALNGQDGYCSSILGTPDYANAVKLLKYILEGSQCHTLDRDNMRAQRDVCGIGPVPALDNAIQAMFDVKYHAWVQDPNVQGCIYGVFDDSLFNQQKLRAASMLGLAGLFSAIAVMLAVSY